VTEFILLGLTQSQEVQLQSFVLISLFYFIILPGNFLIILTIRSDPKLTTPLYFFLSNLAFLDKKVISYTGCITQLFFLHFVGAGEMFLLVVMALDRYIAIYHPLQYSTFMNHRVCYALVMAQWLGGFTHSIIQVALIHYPEIAVLWSKPGHSSERNNKAISTCTTHIIIVFLMFAPAIFIYTRPFQVLPADKVVSLFHTVIFPLLNPVIYTLQNHEVTASMRKLFNHCVIC
uniref:Olfactory receptor n=1 Tax=Jaculus jaculus TaxID=51337 RepID=A0A8C5P5U6_JACJA